MSPMGQILTTCIFLCLTPGAHSLRCIKCIAILPGGLCSFNTCEINPETETCFATVIYLNGKIYEKMLGCRSQEYLLCGKSRDMPAKGFKYEMSCCTDSNFCNGDY